MTSPSPEDIRAWRTGRDLSQVAMAELLGVSDRQVRRWESGEDAAPPMLHYAMAWIGLHGPLEGALLTAAAPDMLAALEALLDTPEVKTRRRYLDRGVGTTTANGRAILDAIAAIAKARGESNRAGERGQA